MARERSEHLARNQSVKRRRHQTASNETSQQSHHRPAPSLGRAQQQKFGALYGSGLPTAFLGAGDRVRPPGGEGGRGPAALKRLDSGPRGELWSRVRDFTHQCGQGVGGDGVCKHAP
jgi:hypothetical protein